MAEIKTLTINGKTYQVEGFPPYISERNTWMVYDTEADAYVDTGITARGYTPQKGEDYYTEEEKEQLISQVIGGVAPESIGARPNTWLPTIAEIGAAPAGYGLGEYAPFITDANEAILPGFYRFDSSKTCANVPSEWQFPYGTMIVSRGSSYIEQLFLAREINAKRTCSGNTWGEWEYINPPMSAGVEYRTIERYNGKPVYVKLINFGALPNATNKDIAFYADETSRPISVEAQVGKVLDSLYMTIPANFGTAIWISAVNYKTIRITTAQNNSDLQARVIVKYWKSTD